MEKPWITAAFFHEQSSLLIQAEAKVRFTTCYIVIRIKARGTVVYLGKFFKRLIYWLSQGCKERGKGRSSILWFNLQMATLAKAGSKWSQHQEHLGCSLCGWQLFGTCSLPPPSQATSREPDWKWNSKDVSQCLRQLQERFFDARTNILKLLKIVYSYFFFSWSF